MTPISHNHPHQVLSLVLVHYRPPVFVGVAAGEGNGVSVGESVDVEEGEDVGVEEGESVTVGEGEGEGDGVSPGAGVVPPGTRGPRGIFS